MPDVKPTDRRGPSLRILVAEDNEFNAHLLEQLLRKHGHTVHVVTAGLETIRVVEAGGHDLLLLDIHMPELDGFGVVERIRARERIEGGHLPIIAVTASSRPADRERCFDVGMDAFVPKPIDAHELWAAIEGVLSTPRL
jgi:two-component system, sensor histidine kinase and response regulator